MTSSTTTAYLDSDWAWDDVYPPLAGLRREMMTDMQWASMSDWEKDLWEMKYRPEEDRLACIEQMLRHYPETQRDQRRSELLEEVLSFVGPTSTPDSSATSGAATPDARLDEVIGVTGLATQMPTMCSTEGLDSGDTESASAIGLAMATVSPTTTAASHDAPNGEAVTGVASVPHNSSTGSLHQGTCEENPMAVVPVSCLRECPSHDATDLAPAAPKTSVTPVETVHVLAVVPGLTIAFTSAAAPSTSVTTVDTVPVLEVAPMVQLQKLYNDSELFRPSSSQYITSKVRLHRPMPWPSFMGVRTAVDEARPWPWPSFSDAYGYEFPGKVVETVLRCSSVHSAVNKVLVCNKTVEVPMYEVSRHDVVRWQPLPPLSEFGENSISDDLKEILDNAASFDLQHCDSWPSPELEGTQRAPCSCESTLGAIPCDLDYFRWEIAWLLVVSYCSHTENGSEILIMSDSVSGTDNKWRLQSCSLKIAIQRVPASDLADATAVDAPDACAESWDTLKASEDLVFQFLFQDNHAPVHHLEYSELHFVHRYSLTLAQLEIAWHLDEKCFDYFQWRVAWTLCIFVVSTDSQFVLATVSSHMYYPGVHYSHSIIFEGCLSACYAWTVLLLSWNYGSLNHILWYATLHYATASLVQGCTVLYGKQCTVGEITSDAFLKYKYCICGTGADSLPASGLSARDNRKSDGDEALITFCRVLLLVLLWSAYYSCSDWSCKSDGKHGYGELSQSDHSANLTLIPLSKLELDGVAAILDMPVAMDGQAKPHRGKMWDPGGYIFVMRNCEEWWTTSELAISQEGRHALIQAMLDLDYYIAFFDKTSVSYGSYLEETGSFDKEYHADINNIRDVHVPWDPGESDLRHPLKTSAWGQADFQEGRNVMTLACRTVFGLISSWAGSNGLGPTDQTRGIQLHIHIDRLRKSYLVGSRRTERLLCLLPPLYSPPSTSDSL